MSLKNTSNSFGWLAKSFHWAVALLIITLWIVGQLMGGMENGLAKFQIYGLHKSTGIVVLTLAVLRLIWKAINVDPTHAGLARWQGMVSTCVHNALYVSMLLMPLSGWLMSSAAGRPVSFFGLFILPDLIAPDKAVAQFYRSAHGFIGWTILALVAAHVGAALLHHFYYKDNILKRMLP